jgi:hypothetical protein
MSAPSTTSSPVIPRAARLFFADQPNTYVCHFPALLLISKRRPGIDQVPVVRVWLSMRALQPQSLPDSVSRDHGTKSGPDAG